MTVIRLDAATLAKFKAAEGRVILADETGKAMQVCILPKIPMEEPNLSPEEWELRVRETGGMSSSQRKEFLQNLDHK